MQGIEFDPLGRRRAYWLHAEHPGDAYGALQNGLQSRPVPASEIAHIYEKQRAQARGVPWGAPVIRSLHDLDDCEVAELVRKKTEACVTAIVFGDDEARQGIRMWCWRKSPRPAPSLPRWGWCLTATRAGSRKPAAPRSHPVLS